MLRSLELPAEIDSAFKAESERSLQAHIEREKSDTISFEEYMTRFENSLMEPEGESEAL